MTRKDGRRPDELRVVQVERGFIKHAEGSALICVGETKVICTATVEERVPPFLKDTGFGWVTAEYGMLPRSTHTRSTREAAKGKQGGRTHEIQRLIGRSLRAVTELSVLGERSVQIDCDVIQADGGTRTASITGSFIALHDALKSLLTRGRIPDLPLTDYLAAVSVGLLNGVPCLDLCYSEDSTAQVDMNIVMTGRGALVEVQGTAEHQPFSRAELDRLIDLASGGIGSLVAVQRDLIGELPARAIAAAGPAAVRKPAG